MEADQARDGESERQYPALRPLPQVTESVNQTFKAELGPERHAGRIIADAVVRVLERMLVLTATIWLNDKTCSTNPPVSDRLRPLTLQYHPVVLWTVQP